MPINVIKGDAKRYKGLTTRKAESKWKKAKKAAEKQNHKDDWPYIQSIYQSMTKKYKQESAMQKTGGDIAYQKHIDQKLQDMGYDSIDDMSTEEKRDFFNQIEKNWESDEEREQNENMDDLRYFILESAEELEDLDETTISANLAIPTNIGGKDSDEDIPNDVHDHEIDDTDDTEEDERTGRLGIKAGSGKNDPNA